MSTPWFYDLFVLLTLLGFMGTCIMILGFFLTEILTAIRESRRLKAGCCHRCGYSLTGNVSGVCPECGKPIRESD